MDAGSQAVKSIEFHRLAFQEVRGAEARYLEEAPHVVIPFRADVDQALGRIIEDPESYPQSIGAYRQLRLSRFPFVIYFRERDETTVFIVAFAHTSRRPGYWRRRKSQ